MSLFSILSKDHTILSGEDDDDNNSRQRSRKDKDRKDSKSKKEKEKKSRDKKDRDRDTERDRDRDKHKKERDQEREREKEKDRLDRRKPRPTSDQRLDAMDMDEDDTEKTRERDKDKDKDKDKSKDDRDDASKLHRRRSSRKSKLSSIDSDSHSSFSRRPQSHKEREPDEFSELPAASSVTDLVPELMSRVSMPYSSFSKLHSKESVRVQNTAVADETAASVAGAQTDPGAGKIAATGTRPTSSQQKPSSKSSEPSTIGASRRPSSSAKLDEDHSLVPPAPTESVVRAPGVMKGTGHTAAETPKYTPTKQGSLRGSKADDGAVRSKASSSQSTYKPNTDTAEEAASALSQNTATASMSGIKKKKKSSSSTPTGSKVKKIKKVRPKTMEISGSLSRPEASPRSSGSRRPLSMGFERRASTSSSPKTEARSPPMPIRTRLAGRAISTPLANLVTGSGNPRPPPPPPPPHFNLREAPRVDYLLANGGLPHAIPREFLAVLPKHTGTRRSATGPLLTKPESLFTPFFKLLEHYQAVVEKQGSIAVATGYRSVARRLLDRLEHVFSRDLAMAGCSCVMCDGDGLEHRGLSWGEVLERVSGRVDLPRWPPFDIATLKSKPADQQSDQPPRPDSPIVLDPDIAPEYRELYIRQTLKVRATVDKWLTKNEHELPIPEEIDDDTLAFLILTNMEQQDRPYFNALLQGLRELQPNLRAPTPMKRPRTDFIVKCGLSVQRLHRLAQAPRDAETALYLVQNPGMHDLLVTISDINEQEWEILTSGRFDGFLWSGAEGGGNGSDTNTPTAENPTPNCLSPGPSAPEVFSPPNGHRSTESFSRTGTPSFGPQSRGPTPASFGSCVSQSITGGGTTSSRAAVSRDEETEMAVLAEIERQIYKGMEVLEDAFETLHWRAEEVRALLRHRGAVLGMSLQKRRTPINGGTAWAPSTDEDAASADQPTTGAAAAGDMADADDWVMEEWEIRPDDSASNISSNRRRKMRRREERRTPAPIQEDVEE